jgi:GT2 family glycosyltransferase
MDAWLPSGEHWKPRGGVKVQERVVVSSFEDRESLAKRLPFLSRFCLVEGGLEKAAAEAIRLGADLLWLRPATHVGENSWNSMMSALRRAPNVASAVCVASDGINAFPKPEEWMPMSSAHVACMERILKERMRGRRMKVAAPFGPCVLLSGAALGMLGTPDVAGFGGVEEQAILEWALRASMRDWSHAQAGDAFASSLSRPPQVTQAQSLRLRGRGTIAKLQDPSETIAPEEREAIELELLASQWKGPRPASLGFGTDYASWKALTDAKRESTIPEWTAKPPILSVVPFDSKAFAAFGWLIHVDDSVELDHDVLAAFSVAISEGSPDVQVVYADHETRFPDGKIVPEFKPDFDLELFLAQDYVTPICAVRVNQPFGDRAALFAHALDIALKHGAKAFVHVPRTLGVVASQAKPEEMAIDAINRQLAIQDRLGDSAKVTAHKRIPGCLSVVRDWKAGLKEWREHGTAPLVSIVIPTLGGGRLIQPCVATLLQHTDYPNFEVVVVQNGERREPELNEAIMADPRVKVVRWEGKFNWSAINNWAIRFHSKGGFVLTMNDDVCVGTKTWLDAMMGHAVLRDVGAVGARLVHPSGVMQHCGVVAHRGAAGHMHKGTQNGSAGHMGRAVLTHEASAVTGACMLFSRKNFDAVGGFDETMPMNYNDTDFCLHIRKKSGLRIVVESTAELLHSEGASRGDVMSAESLRRLARENAAFARRHPEPDPYWSPNLHFGLVHDGIFIGGGNADVLAWEDFPPREGSETVLIVNDLPGIDGLSLDVLRTGDVAMVADLSGFALTMRGPIPQNARPWDIRDPRRMDEGLKLLGVDRIVLRSLVGAQGAAPPVEALRCFAALNVPVEFDPIEEWMVRPVDSEGREDAKVFGSVDRTAWEAAYLALLPEEKQGKPTIAELEAILADPRPPHVQIMPDGSIRAFTEYPGEFKAPKVLTYEEGMDLISRSEGVAE